MDPLLGRLFALALLAAVSLLLFFPLNTGSGRLKQSRFARFIPFVPAFIVPYLGLFPYIVFSMLAVLFFTPVAARLYTSLIVSGLIAALIWYFLPTVVLERPELEPEKGILHRAVAWMYRTDPGGNASPSSHTFIALICSYYLTYAFPLYETTIWVCGATIVSSTLFVRQHHFSDLVAGVVLAAASIAVSYLILGGLA